MSNSTSIMNDLPVELRLHLLRSSPDLKTAASLLRLTRSWSALCDEEETWEAISEACARGLHLHFDPRMRHGCSWRDVCVDLLSLRQTFATSSNPVMKDELQAFNIKVGVRFRPPDGSLSSSNVIVPLHQRLQLIRSAHQCSPAEARRRLWAANGESHDPLAFAELNEPNAEVADFETAEDGAIPQPISAEVPVAALASERKGWNPSSTSAGVLAIGSSNITICAPSIGIRNFEFDHNWSPAASQQQIFEPVAPLVFDLLNGRSAAILAYGQTGSGKTHTMWGEAVPDSLSALPTCAGIVPRALQLVLAALSCRRQLGLFTELRMSCVEVFCNTVHDLLDGGAAVGAWQGVAARAIEAGTTEVGVIDMEHALTLLKRADAAKRRAATLMNERSSRAHCVLRLVLVQRKGVSPAVQSTLTLADLGGCEVLSKSNATGERLAEAVSINLGLLALKSVMSALHKKSSYVPYQNNKLTMLLQSSLGTHGRSFVIVTGRTEGAHVVETLEALRFAETCSQVTLRSHRFAAASMVAALHTLDAQIEAVQQLIARKERWETRTIRRRDVRAGLAAGMVGMNGAYKTDTEFEEVKVSGLVGAEVEHKELERLLFTRRELVGCA